MIALRGRTWKRVVRTGLIGRDRVGRGVVDVGRSGLLEMSRDVFVIWRLRTRKVKGSEGEWRMLFAMCLLLWQLESWTGVAYWVIGKLWE